MKFMNVTTPQLLILALAISIISAATSCGFYFYMDYRTLPMVYTDPAGACVKVENFENGQAFNCNDVDVTLRRYRHPAK